LSSTETPADAPVEDAPPRDELREGLVETLKGVLGDDLLDNHVEKGDVWVRVPVSRWHDALQAARDQLGCRYFCFLSGIDWMPSTAPNPEAEEGDAPAAPATPAAATIETGYAGGDARFQVFARLYDVDRHVGITIKADVDDADPVVPSVVDLFAGADWHEREAWEMYGFRFDGHPALRHLFLPGEFEGHPLRKDFPLLAREVKPWPGLVDVEPMPGDDDEATEGDATAEGGDA
jgi:NADH-quinone oxidoreductase subunit C